MTEHGVVMRLVPQRVDVGVLDVEVAERDRPRRAGRLAGGDDGAVVTACQSACPTRAITFGDLNVKNSKVNALRHEPHHYAMLEHLGTRPRTTYLARLQNPNPSLQDKNA